MVLLVPSWMKFRFDDVALDKIQMAFAGATNICATASRPARHILRMTQSQEMKKPDQTLLHEHSIGNATARAIRRRRLAKNFCVGLDEGLCLNHLVRS